jgi:hypothetical protein
MIRIGLVGNFSATAMLVKTMVKAITAITRINPRDFIAFLLFVL